MVGDILQPTHLLFVLIIALLVLGPKRLPEVAKTLGKGIRDFRGAISGDSDHANSTPSYLSGDSASDHDAPPEPVSQTPPAAAETTPAPVSESPAAVPAPTPAPTPATTTVPTPAADPQPAQPSDEPVQPVVTPATTAPPAPPASSPVPASPPQSADDAGTQAHPAASSAEQHE